MVTVYRRIKQRELRANWKKESKHKKDKIRRMLPVVPDSLEGIQLTDKALEDKFGTGGCSH